MSAPVSVEELLQLIRKSGMVDEGKLTAYLQRRQKGRGIPTDPREAAEGMVADGIITNFQSEQFLLGKWRGFTIGKFKLLERVGVGGMGQVFLCEHMFMKRRVAVKVLPPAKAEHPAALGRFYREARAAGLLDHPNIVRTHDIDQDGNLHFIVMEYVDGSNMLDIIKKYGPMDIGRAVSYVEADRPRPRIRLPQRHHPPRREARQCARSIARGTPKSSTWASPASSRTTTDNLTVKYDDKIVLGTADYVAPEQVANSHSVDVRADVYALGATLYFLLAGHPPFPTGTVSQKLLWHRTKEPTAIRQIRPEVSEELAAILVKMMAKDPNVRYQSPGEVLAALTPYAPATLLPPVAEMPTLCLAVTEGQEQVVDLVPQTAESVSRVPVMAGVGAGSGITAAETRQRPLANPFGPTPTTPTAPAAFAPLPPAKGGSRLTKLGTGSAHALPRLEAHAPAPSSPYHQARSHDATPLPGTVPVPGHAADGWPQARPAGPSVLQKVALYLILAASVAVGGGIIYWKFVRPRFVDMPATSHAVVHGSAVTQA